MGELDGRRDDDLAIFGAPTRLELGLAMVALLVGLVLLVSIYTVTRQAVDRGQSQWSQALQRASACSAPSGAAAADPCAPPMAPAFDGQVVSQVAR